MSDMLSMRPFLGNFGERPGAREATPSFPGKRRLVEECEVVSVWSVQRAFGKKPLVAAIREARPFRLPLSGGHCDVWLVDEIHRLPGRLERWSSLDDLTSRLWFQCVGCLAQVSKLYFYTLPGSSERSELLCRNCHYLTYVCNVSGRTTWYKEVARPLKRLLKEREHLLRRRHTSRLNERLEGVERQIRALKAQLKPRTVQQSPPFVARQRRRYRDISLLGA